MNKEKGQLLQKSCPFSFVMTFKQKHMLNYFLFKKL